MLPNQSINKKHYVIKVNILEEYFDTFVALISDLNFSGVVEGLDVLEIYFDEKDWNENLENEIRDILNDSELEAEVLNFEIIEERNWNEEWEKHVTVVDVSDNIVITPSWRQNETNKPIKVIIDPKMSFGTGHHSSTKLVSRLMENSILPNSNTLDVGTGTGVLAILAIKLGAANCLAFDNNEWSINNAIENVELNNVKDKISIDMIDIDNTDLSILGEFHHIFANLFFPLIMRSMENFAKALDKTKGTLFISGIMIFDRDEVIRKAKECGFELIELIEEDEWSGFKFKKI